MIPEGKEAGNVPGSEPQIRVKGRKRRSALRIGLSVVLLGASLWFLWRTGSEAGWSNLVQRISEVSFPLLALAASINLLRYGFWALRWQLLLRPVCKVPWWGAQRALMASVFFNTVVPGARPFGGLIRARYLARSSGLAPGTLYGGALVDQVGYSLVSMGLGLVFLPAALLPTGAGQGPGRWFLLPSFAVLGAFFFLAWRHRDGILERLRRRLPTMAEALTGVFRAARTVMGRPRSWALMALGGMAVWAGNVLTFQIAAAALGAPISFSVAAAAFSLGALAGAASGTPGGAGATEAAAVIPLVHLGVPGDLALASVLLARGIHYLSAIVLGGICALAGR